jgi:hypothetical protein
MRVHQLQQEQRFYSFQQILRENPKIHISMQEEDSDFDEQTLRPVAVQDVQKLLHDAMCAESP